MFCDFLVQLTTGHHISPIGLWVFWLSWIPTIAMVFFATKALWQSIKHPDHYDMDKLKYVTDPHCITAWFGAVGAVVWLPWVARLIAEKSFSDYPMSWGIGLLIILMASWSAITLAFCGCGFIHLVIGGEARVRESGILMLMMGGLMATGPLAFMADNDVFVSLCPDRSAERVAPDGHTCLWHVERISEVRPRLRPLVQRCLQDKKLTRTEYDRIVNESNRLLVADTLNVLKGPK